MDPELISKKELLAQYGISYGALYRWKRMGLIPEDWFLRKATSTGQETFFHRGQICPRVERILARKEGSLEDLARELAGATPQEPLRQLLIEGPYQTLRLDLKELTAVKLIADGKELDILQQLKGALHG